MKKFFLVVFVIISTVTIANSLPFFAKTSSQIAPRPKAACFCCGFNDGFYAGWAKVKGSSGWGRPTAPPCPRGYENSTDYNSGYNWGYKVGHEEARKH